MLQLPFLSSACRSLQFCYCTGCKSWLLCFLMTCLSETLNACCEVDLLTDHILFLSDDELLRSAVKRLKPNNSTSGGPICSICEVCFFVNNLQGLLTLVIFHFRLSLCVMLFGLFFSQSGIGSCLLIQCQNSSCSRSFHTFCLDPPLQDVSGTWECFLCKINQASLAKVTEVYPLKKIQRLVGHRRVILQESDFQYQFLVKWQLLSHHHDCWVCFPSCSLYVR